ncbi:MAG: sugar ABC transporter substrate-binding protein [Chloroflexi bacterium]|nr:sugar ABC transporter substrate-binding protein [Chloroflexota bacterium]
MRVGTECSCLGGHHRQMKTEDPLARRGASGVFPEQSCSRRRLLARGMGVAAGVTALGAAGCIPGKPAETTATLPASGPPAQVVFMRTANPTLAAAYDAQSAAFNKQQQRVVGRFEAAAVAQNETWLTKLTTMLASDTAPDCFLLPQDILPAIASTGALLVLDPYIRRDAKEVNTADFFPRHLEGGRWQERQVALTPDGCAILEYYSINLFRDAGVALPKPTWTWQDYMEAARRLTKQGDGGLVQVGIENSFDERQLLPWLWSNGTDVFSPDFKTVRVTERPTQDAIQFVVDLVRRYSVTTMSPGAAVGGNAFRSGKAAMMRANRGAFGQLANVNSFTFNVVPIARAPQTGSSTTFTGPGHIGIAKTNKQPAAAWEWLKFLTSAEAQIIRSTVQQGGCPSRNSATQHPSYTETTIPALESKAANKTFADVLTDPKMARFVPQYVAMDEAMDTFSKHVANALQGTVSVPAAMQNAQRELEELLRRRPQPAR